MKQELKNQITEWINDEYKIGHRSVQKMNLEGEYLINISEKVPFKANNKARLISVDKKFRTSAQSDTKLDSKGDVIQFEQIVRLLSYELNKEINDTLIEFFLDYEGDFTEVE